MVKSVEIVPVLSYYNTIAEQYDSFMQGEADKRTREFVRNEFIKTVPAGNILDFGGGTGLDLPWLLEHNKYNVFFFEPSSKMRDVAQNYVSGSDCANKPTIIREHLNISDWTSHQLPVTKKMDGVLANFAVLNCIKDINEFFEKLTLVCNKGAHVTATVLDSRLPTIIKKYPVRTKVSAILGIETIIYNHYNGIGHATYLHPLKQLKTAAAAHFDFVSCTPIEDSDFALVTFIRK
jgi:ubiquinone/menaquinone biosynthesis C-methylase UbiE